MKRSLYILILTTLLGLGLAWSGSSSQAQAPGPISLQADAAAIGDFPDVTLSLTVRDANGIPLPELEASHFEILETGVNQPRPITAVETRFDPEAPIAVMLVIDVSGSMRGQPMADAKTAAIRFLEQLGEQDRAAVIAFSTLVDFDAPNPDLEREFTTDKEELIALVETLEAGGGTALYDALFKAIRQTDRADLGYRAILLLTDGVDEGPGSQVATRDTPVQEAQRANLPIFTIGLGSLIDPGYLELLARTTGGTFQLAPDSDLLDETFQNVIERLKQQYLVTYESGYDCDGRSHRVEVRVSVAARSASDSLMLGPLVNNPGCNPAVLFTPTPTPTLPPVATATPQPTAPTPTGEGGIGPVVTPPLVDDLPPPTAEGLPWGLLGALLLLLLGGITAVVWRRRREPERICQQCGYRLSSVDVACPECGSRTVSKGLRR